MILSNCWVVTMDDSGTEYPSGWLRVEDGLVVEAGAGDPPEREAQIPKTESCVEIFDALNQARGRVARLERDMNHFAPRG